MVEKKALRSEAKTTPSLKETAMAIAPVIEGFLEKQNLGIILNNKNVKFNLQSICLNFRHCGISRLIIKHVYGANIFQFT